MAEKSAQPQMSKEELIGYHKGCVNTLISERAELLRIVQVTESLLQAHVAEMEKLGVKLQTSQADDSKTKKSA